MHHNKDNLQFVIMTSTVRDALRVKRGQWLLGVAGLQQRQRLVHFLPGGCQNLLQKLQVKLPGAIPVNL